MVNFDRYVSAFSSQLKTRLTRAKSVVDSATSTRWTGVSPGTLSPRARAIAAGGALAVVTGVVAPVAVAGSGHAEAATPAVTASAAATSQSSSAHSAPAPAPQNPAPQAPNNDQLHPMGIQGGQSDIPLSGSQMANAQKIVAAGQSMGLPPRAWVIAVATSMQETKLHNYGDLGGSNDHDSLGLFQQRPSSGWGSPQQIENPTHAAQSFYKHLENVPNWQKMPLTKAAQKVQVSAFGSRYAQWEAKAGDVVDAMYGQGPLANGGHSK